MITNKEAVKRKLSLLMSSFEKILNKLVLLEKQKIEIDSDFKNKMKIWKEKHNDAKYKLTDSKPIDNLVLKRLKNKKKTLKLQITLKSIRALIVKYDEIIPPEKRTNSPLSLPKKDLLNFMYDNRGFDKSSSNISKISSIKSKSSSMNKSKSSSSANKKKELWSKMKNIREQNLNDNSIRGGKY
jgi:hypothetical protein